MITKFGGLRFAALIAITCLSSVAHADDASAMRTLTLSWEPPTQNVDGTPLTDLLGYYIYVGDSPDSMMPMCYTGPGRSSFVLGAAADSTRYFAIAAVNADGIESVLTGPVGVPPIR